MRLRILALLALITALLSGCGYNQIQINDEAVSGAWSEVLNQYKRRADLVPNLVSIVQGYAAHEKEVLTQVTEARASVGSIKATPELVNDEAAFAKFQKAQADLSSALGRLLVVSENYPQLKANENFTQLQKELSDTEDKVAYSRQYYNSVVNDYNIRIRTFPNTLFNEMLGFSEKDFFAASEAERKAVKVSFE